MPFDKSTPDDNVFYYMWLPFFSFIWVMLPRRFIKSFSYDVKGLWVTLVTKLKLDNELFSVGKVKKLENNDHVVICKVCSWNVDDETCEVFNGRTKVFNIFKHQIHVLMWTFEKLQKFSSKNDEFSRFSRVLFSSNARKTWKLCKLPVFIIHQRFITLEHILSSMAIWNQASW